MSNLKLTCVLAVCRRKPANFSILITCKTYATYASVFANFFIHRHMLAELSRCDRGLTCPSWIRAFDVFCIFCLKHGEVSARDLGKTKRKECYLTHPSPTVATLPHPPPCTPIGLSGCLYTWPMMWRPYCSLCLWFLMLETSNILSQSPKVQWFSKLAITYRIALMVYGFRIKVYYSIIKCFISCPNILV